MDMDHFQSTADTGRPAIIPSSPLVPKCQSTEQQYKSINEINHITKWLKLNLRFVCKNYSWFVLGQINDLLRLAAKLSRKKKHTHSFV